MKIITVITQCLAHIYVHSSSTIKISYYVQLTKMESHYLCCFFELPFHVTVYHEYFLCQVSSITLYAGFHCMDKP